MKNMTAILALDKFELIALKKTLQRTLQSDYSVSEEEAEDLKRILNLVKRILSNNFESYGGGQEL